jgi:signal peptidase II
MTGLFTRNRLIGLGLAALIAVMDQWTKWLVTVPLEVNRDGAKMDLLPFFDLTYTRNYGVATGLLEATDMEMRWLLVALTMAIALGVFIWILREKLLGEILGLALILGGAIGNIIDRYTLGYVIDFADFHIGDFRPFLIFNLADAAITIGVVMILARALFFSEKDEDSDIQASSDSKAAPEN